jgi:nitrogen fixation protein FixH
MVRVSDVVVQNTMTASVIFSKPVAAAYAEPALRWLQKNARRAHLVSDSTGTTG